MDIPVYRHHPLRHEKIFGKNAKGMQPFGRFAGLYI